MASNIVTYSPNLVLDGSNILTVIIIFHFIANDENEPSSFDYFKKYTALLFFDPKFLFCFRSGLAFACKVAQLQKADRSDQRKLTSIGWTNEPCTAQLAIFRELPLG